MTDVSIPVPLSSDLSSSSPSPSPLPLPFSLSSLRDSFSLFDSPPRGVISSAAILLLLRSYHFLLSDKEFTNILNSFSAVSLSLSSTISFSSSSESSPPLPRSQIEFDFPHFCDLFTYCEKNVRREVLSPKWAAERFPLFLLEKSKYSTFISVKTLVEMLTQRGDTIDKNDIDIIVKECEELQLIQTDGTIDFNVFTEYLHQKSLGEKYEKNQNPVGSIADVDNNGESESKYNGDNTVNDKSN